MKKTQPRPKTLNKTQKITIRFTEKEFVKIDKLALKAGKTYAKFCRRLIRRAIENQLSSSS